jgi:hypothetical protein
MILDRVLIYFLVLNGTVNARVLLRGDFLECSTFTKLTNFLYVCAQSPVLKTKEIKVRHTIM